jgi:ribosome-binding protein aMBF1 (putative translation factor)
MAELRLSILALPLVSVLPMAGSTKDEYQAERTAYPEGLAANVRRLREERGWSQTDLHDKADLHRTEIGRIEGAESLAS